MTPLVFRMAVPAVVAQLVNLLYNLVDRIYIGHIYGIGTEALAATSGTSTASGPRLWPVSGSPARSSS